MATLICDIVTPVEKVYSEECYMVTVPGEEGYMGFLPGHAPLMSTLADGEVRIFSDTTTLINRFVCQGGYVQVTGEKVIVLADRAMSVENIDAKDAAEQVTELATQLESLAEDGAQRAVVAYDLKWYEILVAAAASK